MSMSSCALALGRLIVTKNIPCSRSVLWSQKRILTSAHRGCPSVRNSRHASTEASKPPGDPENLSELPHLPPKRRTVLNDQEFLSYGTALKSYLWSIEQQETPGSSSGVLQKQFVFKEFDDAVDFLNDVVGIAKSENHHPDILLRYRTVIVSTHTHEAKTTQGDAGKRVSDALTLRDVRLAILVEQLYRDQYAAADRIQNGT